MRRLGVVVRAVLGVAIIVAGVSGAMVPAHADAMRTSGAPTRVVTGNATATSLLVSWAAPDYTGGAVVTAYVVQYRKVGQIAWSTFAHDASIARSVTVNGLEPGSTYVFRVAAVSSAGVSPWSTQETTVDVGSDHACAVIANGTVKCWGSNEGGELGTGSFFTSSTVPVLVSGITGKSASSTALTVSVGNAHSCAVMVAGTVKCWGRNDFGQLGDDSNTEEYVPEPVSVSGITGESAATSAVSVAAGFLHSCALMANGTVLCWGGERSGSQGTGVERGSRTPTRVLGIDGLTEASTAVSVSTQEHSTCALMVSGAIQCWGENLFGQLGDGTKIDRWSPVAVSGIDGARPSSTAVSVSVGPLHACAVMVDKSVKCWGYNGDGAFGNGTTTNSSIPVLASGITSRSGTTTAISVSAGVSYTCAVMAVGTAQCWGFNSQGSLGNGKFSKSLVPVSVSGITGAEPTTTALMVSAGYSHTCALMGDASVECWGANSKGQLGTGKLTEREPLPSRVVGIGGSRETTRAFVSSAGVTLAAPGAPGRPEIGTRTSSSIRIAWTAAADNGSALTNYLVQYRAGAGPWTTFSRSRSTTLSAVVTGLVKGASYTFRVSAVSAAGTGPASAISAAVLVPRIRL